MEAPTRTSTRRGSGNVRGRTCLGSDNSHKEWIRDSLEMWEIHGFKLFADKKPISLTMCIGLYLKQEDSISLG